MFKLILSEKFIQRLQKFSKRHPDLKKKLARTFKDLEKDPFQSSLKLHPLQGFLQGLHAVSINYEYRLILTLRMTPKEIILIDIGTHDEVYR